MLLCKHTFKEKTAAQGKSLAGASLKGPVGSDPSDLDQKQWSPGTCPNRGYFRVGQVCLFASDARASPVLLEELGRHR